MSTNQNVMRDERTVAVENVSFKWAFSFLVFALLVDVMYRALVCHEAAWDLMFLACVPGMICTIYQARQKIWGRGFPWKAMLIVGLAAGVVAFFIAALYQFHILH